MATQSPQDTPFYPDASPETSLRICDEAMVRWLETIKFRDQTPKVSTAWQSRHYAQIKEEPSGAERQAFTWPRISLMMSGITPALDRRVTGIVGALGSGSPSDTNRMYAKSDKTEVYVLPYPLPYDLSYQVDIWAKTQQDIQYLRSGILGRISHVDTVFLCATFPGYGEKLLPLVLSGVQDTSDLETGEKERELRNTLNFTMNAWIFRVPIVRKTIKRASVVVVDASGSGNLEEGSDFLDWYGDNANYTFDSNGLVTAVAESPDFTPPNRVLAVYQFPGV